MVDYSLLSVLLIEKSNHETVTFGTGLVKKGIKVDIVFTGANAMEYLQTRTPDVVLINAASMRTNGKRISYTIRKYVQNIPLVLVVDSNDEIDIPDVDLLLERPTLQMLLNRLKIYIPVQTQNCVRAGNIFLDIEQRQMKIGDRQVGLTPILVDIMNLFLRAPGETLRREEIFKKVWGTSYIGDTRTLDVHISWLRNQIEIDPRSPRYIKTVRGVGYRFDVK